MQATTTGSNRTGEAVSPQGVQAMTAAVLRYSPPTPIDTSASDEDHALYIAEAEAIGSVPPPASLKGSLKSGMGKLTGERPELLLDKIGERIAFERAGTRLYDALIVKYQAAVEAGSELPTAAEAIAAQGEQGASLDTLRQELPMQTLQRIRDEELQHFHLLCQAMRRLGGDPTAQTPCADVAATASAGIVQVITDPRTTLAQSLNALLTAELSDNAGWELLIQLTEQAGEDELTGAFLGALAQEAQHVLIVRQWLTALLSAEKSSVLV
ncbi:MAG: ferritin Dps family protein [Hydrogenophaga sp.]|uniref:ferritin-like domain-containing protein n=1 Tax=Hydrogenophaga sp. TaxID=1904254 RepID=UPI0016BA4182|nr:ferritin-like domain-containing protein [Hydrogenophaga sp.]NIM42673.1 ferritin Dps family protein [Hydrogenophaga sp.]NIN25716.1 ferritin Dps family protein [Hydrogenophaga sp.]NIN30378.1 ferritin Dps family protein [Hydrogenophaga sp.]NIN56718.1 ferritin Dps family protein [Hydrogenophaga sp.]NIO53293.1 ferritin Dps family protein [Hydrogenophaga sp.]